MNLRLLESRIFCWVVVSIASLFVFVRSMPTLPTVMQDEYIYLSQALLQDVSENEYGNFLHSLIYSIVGAFGEDFYSGVKLINTFFLMLFGGFAFLTARTFLDNKLASVLGVGSVLSATGLYASIFTPEMMFFSMASAAVFFLTISLEGQAKRPLVLTAVSLSFLTLAGLTKPHAIILCLGVVLFFAIAILLRSVERPRGLFSIGIFLLGYPALKFFIGFLIAGQSGLTLLGKNYENSLSIFFDGLAVFSEGSLTAAGASIGSYNGASFASFSSFVLVQFFVLVAALLFMTFGLPLLLVRPVGELNNFQLLVVTVSAVYLIVVAGFSGVVTFSGDDHSARILARYFEFLVPFIFIAVLIEASKRNRLSTKRLILTAMTIIALAIIWLVFISKTDFRLADSGILLGAFRASLIPWLIIVLGLVFLVLLRQRPVNLMTLSTMLIVGMMSVIGIFSLQRQIDLNSVKAPADYAGDDIRANFPDVQGEDILVVGTNGQLAFVTKFWSLKSDVYHVLTEPGTITSIDDGFFNGYTLVVELPNVSITDGIVLKEGNGYRILGKKPLASF